MDFIVRKSQDANTYHGSYFKNLTNTKLSSLFKLERNIYTTVTIADVEAFSTIFRFFSVDGSCVAILCLFYRGFDFFNNRQIRKFLDRPWCHFCVQRFIKAHISQHTSYSFPIC